MTAPRPPLLRRLWHWFATTPAQDFDEFLAGDATPRRHSEPHPDADPEACARECVPIWTTLDATEPATIPPAAVICMAFIAACALSFAAGWVLRGWWGA